MKKTLLILILFFSNLTFAQVTTSPATPTANDEITIHFDATGTGLDGYTGDVYAHTGVTINGTRWSYVIESWGNNTTQPKLTHISENEYELVITPEVYSFYSVPTTEIITEICIVFRSADGNSKTSDIFIPIYEEGLNVAFTSPSNNSVYNLNDAVTISAEASQAADLEIFINDISIANNTNSTTISSLYTFTTAGNFNVKITATDGTNTAEDEITLFVKSPTQEVSMPSGLKNGVNNNGDGTVTLVLLAPNKSDVFLLGDFNNWELNTNYQMYKDGEYFWITLNNLDANTEYAYQYLIDYAIKVADPYSEKILDPWNDQYISSTTYPNLKAYPENLTTGYVSTFKINEEVYNWNVTDFERPNQNNLIIYELHVRDFTESDTYNEALTHLDYLKSLGVNAIELMPINEFEGNDSWGYNPALYMALDKAYGTKNDFKKFVDACHERGIAVITDVVFNHSYGQSPLVQMYWDSVNNKPAADNPWYNQNHNFVDNTSAQWGYDFNHESTYTKTFFDDVLTYWLTEYNVDGFRFDFTKGFTNTLYYGSDNWASAYDASRITILKNYADHVWSYNTSNKPYVIFEHLSENSEETELANYGIMLWGNMNYSYNQNTMGYSEGSDVAWISYKQRGWSSPNLVGYMESHDEERLMYKNLQYGNSSGNYNVTDLNTALSREELAGMFFFTIPGPKMIWQFGELGYDYSIDYNDRVGRKPVKWDYFDNVNRKQIYNTWATLIEFKKQEPVFNSTDFTLNVSGLTKSITLKNSEKDVVLVGNFDVSTKTITVQFTKTGTWYEYFTGEEKAVTSTSTSITLNPGEYKLYSSVKLLDPRGGTENDDSDNDGVVDTDDLCPNTPEGTTVNSTGCPLFTLASDNFTIETVSETCPDKNNGQIIISADESYNYVASLNGTDYSFTTSKTISSLTPATYELCISIPEKNYTQCYMITIAEGTTISAKSSNTKSGRTTVEIEEGTAPFIVYVNGNEAFKTYNQSFDIDLKNGDVLEIKTAVKCEGVYTKQTSLNNNALTAFPNPTSGVFEITVPTSKKELTIDIYNIHSQLVSSKKYPVIYGKVYLNIENKPVGLYIAKVNLDTPVNVKIIKN